MAWKLLGNFEILLLEILYLRKAVGKVLIGTPFTHLQKSHYCFVHSVYFHNQTNLVNIIVLTSYPHNPLTLHHSQKDYVMIVDACL